MKFPSHILPGKSSPALLSCLDQASLSFSGKNLAAKERTEHIEPEIGPFLLCVLCVLSRLIKVPLLARNPIRPGKPFSIVSAKRAAAFTMIEIAISLAIIGFALVAIIGVLPAGMSVQKDNREGTLINFDADFLLSAIRSGARGQDDLTNYIVAITNYSTSYDRDTNFLRTDTSWFTTTNFSVEGTSGSYFLTNGSNIIGLLTTPKYEFFGKGFISNYVTADFRGISGAAVDQAANEPSRDFAFRYRVTSEVIPYVFYDPSLTNYGPIMNLSPSDTLTRSNYMRLMQGLQANSSDVRLRFRWPVLPNGQTGNSRQVFRTSLSGQLTNVFVPGLPLTLYYVTPQNYTNVFTNAVALFP